MLSATSSSPYRQNGSGSMGACDSRSQVGRWELALVVLLLVYFAARLGYFAVRVHPSNPPDEITHFGLCVAFSSAALVPADSADTFRYGAIAHQPFFYYLLMGKLLSINVFPLSDLVFLRLMNGALGVLTAIYGYRWIGLLTGNALVRLLFLAMLTNTLMFTGLSASVSYDNLANLLVAMSFFYLFAFFDQRNAKQVAAFALSILAGCITKRTLLPLAFVLVAGLAGGSVAAETVLTRPRKRPGSLMLAMK